jgi:hypothetical protein
MPVRDGGSVTPPSVPVVDVERWSALLDGRVDGAERDHVIEELAKAPDAMLSAFCDAVHVIREAEITRLRVPSCSLFPDGFFGSGCW